MMRPSYPFAVGIVEGFKLHNVGMPDNSHNLKLAILYQAIKYLGLRSWEEGHVVP